MVDTTTQEQFQAYLDGIGYKAAFEKAQAMFEHSRWNGKNLCKLDEDVALLL
jgi:hypothetical protein